MTWSRAIPLVPGYYWWRRYPGGRKKIVYIERLGTELECRQRDQKVTNMDGEWTGPIVEPSE